MDERKRERGQGLLEMALMLPVLLILLIGVAEVGFMLRNYLVVVNASREGGRFAARGRYSDENIIERVVSAGGTIRAGTFITVPFLRTQGVCGTEPNTGIIVTHVVMSSTGAVDSTSVTFSGVRRDEPGGWRLVEPGDGTLTAQIENRHRPSTESIKAMREAEGYEPMINHIVVVEVFYLHQPLLNSPFVPLPDPLEMYARTEMRVITDLER